MNTYFNEIKIIEDSRVLVGMAKHFESVSWCGKATAPANDIRETLRSLCVRDGFVCGTDGRRLHIYRQPEDNVPVDMVLTDGLWTIKTKTKKQLILEKSGKPLDEYPNVWGVFSPQPEFLGNFRSNSRSLKDQMDAFDEFVFTLIHTCDRVYPLAHLRDAFLSDTILSVEMHGKQQMLVFGNDERIACVMPFVQKEIAFESYDAIQYLMEVE